MQSTKKDVNIKIGLAWLIMNKLSTLLDSALNRKIKIMSFRAAVESLLIYGA